MLNIYYTIFLRLSIELVKYFNFFEYFAQKY
nr:MAG TPA: hypothetical protein [Caudoviricetes sp.]